MFSGNFSLDDDGDDDGGDGDNDSILMFDYRCNEGSTMEGSSTVICDGHHWNSSAPICLSKLQLQICSKPLL